LGKTNPLSPSLKKIYKIQKEVREKAGIERKALKAITSQHFKTGGFRCLKK